MIWRLDEQFHVKDVWFGRTVIRSRYKLAYEVKFACMIALYRCVFAHSVGDEIAQAQAMV